MEPIQNIRQPRSLMIRRLLGVVIFLYGISMLFVVIYEYFCIGAFHVSIPDLGKGLFIICLTIYAGDNWMRGKRSTDGI